MRDAPFGSLRQPLERDGSNHEDSRGSDNVNASTLVSSHFNSRALAPGSPLAPILFRLALHGRGGGLAMCGGVVVVVLRSTAVIPARCSSSSAAFIAIDNEETVSGFG